MMKTALGAIVLLQAFAMSAHAQQQQQVAAPAAPQIEGARPKAAAKKKAEVVEDAGDDEPEVRKESAPTNAVPKKSGIAATVDAWDTDD